MPIFCRPAPPSAGCMSMSSVDFASRRSGPPSRGDFTTRSARTNCPPPVMSRPSPLIAIFIEPSTDPEMPGIDATAATTGSSAWRSRPSTVMWTSPAPGPWAVIVILPSTPTDPDGPFGPTRSNPALKPVGWSLPVMRTPNTRLASSV